MFQNAGGPATAAAALEQRKHGLRPSSRHLHAGPAKGKKKPMKKDQTKTAKKTWNSTQQWIPGTEVNFRKLSIKALQELTECKFSFHFAFRSCLEREKFAKQIRIRSRQLLHYFF